MDITEELTNKAKGNNRSYLSVVNDEITERQKAKQEEAEKNKVLAEGEKSSEVAATEGESSKEPNSISKPEGEGLDKEQKGGEI
ncbi:hypothetical protein AB205_0132240, partial [Aquarana catesbeiana]